MSGEVNELDGVIDEVLGFKPLAVVKAATSSAYSYVRESYRILITGIMTEYLFADKSNRVHYSGQFKGEMFNSFKTALEVGWNDGGGDINEIDSDTLEWLEIRSRAEAGYIDMLFLKLKDVRDNQEPSDYPGIIDQHAEGYTQTLDGIYNEGKIRAGKDIALTFVGEDGAESCKTCQKWKGKRHRKSFWLKRGLIPGQPGNTNFECRGYNCEHYLVDDNGVAYTF